MYTNYCNLLQITRLSQVSLSQIATGEVINLLSNDVCRFDLVVLHLNSLWVIPTIMPIVLYLIWREVGLSSFAGVACLVLVSLPIQGRSFI